MMRVVTLCEFIICKLVLKKRFHTFNLELKLNLSFKSCNNVFYRNTYIFTVIHC